MVKTPDEFWQKTEAARRLRESEEFKELHLQARLEVERREKKAEQQAKEWKWRRFVKAGRIARALAYLFVSSGTLFALWSWNRKWISDFDCCFVIGLLFLLSSILWIVSWQVTGISILVQNEYDQESRNR